MAEWILDRVALCAAINSNSIDFYSLVLYVALYSATNVKVASAACMAWHCLAKHCGMQPNFVF